MKTFKTSAALMLAAFAVCIAKAFAVLPCVGPYCEPKMPEQLKKRPTQAGCCLTTRNQASIIIVKEFKK